VAHHHSAAPAGKVHRENRRPPDERNRVRFSSPGSPLVAKANLDRLIRSLRKWRDLHSLPYSAEDEEYLRLKSIE